jgi:hypothetical protein
MSAQQVVPLEHGVAGHPPSEVAPLELPLLLPLLLPEPLEPPLEPPLELPLPPPLLPPEDPVPLELPLPPPLPPPEEAVPLDVPPPSCPAGGGVEELLPHAIQTKAPATMVAAPRDRVARDAMACPPGARGT